MSIEEAVVYAAIFINIVYLFMGVKAYSHLDKEKAITGSQKFLSLTFWWPFYDIYLASAKKICLIGKLVLAIDVILYSLIYFYSK